MIKHVGEHTGPPTEAQLRNWILGYLNEHPSAMDTLDGIAEWWISRRQVEIEVRRVSRVIEEMVADGELELCEQDGVRFYHRTAVGPSGKSPLEGVFEP